MELTIEEYDSYSPLLAYLGEKSDQQQEKILDRFEALSDPERAILVDTETVEKLLDLTQRQVIPATHTKAVAVLLAIVLLGEAEPEQIGPLLEKIGLLHETATRITSALEPILAPALQARMMQKMQPMPTLNRPSESGPKPLIAKPAPGPIPQSASRNIIDLRKP